MHADEAERQRQRRRGERAEDDEQDQRDDREAARLGFGEVFLGELLHPGPDRRLPGQVGGDARRRRCRGRGLRAGSRPSRSARRRTGSLRSGSSAVPVRCSCQLGRGAPRPAAASLRRPSATSRRTRSTAAARSAAARRRARPAAAPRSRRPCAPKSLLQRFADRLRLAAGDVEAAAGEVIGLVRGERQGDERRSATQAPRPSGGGGRGTPRV